MAKKVTMMILDSCPHCQEAFRMMARLRKEHPEYASVELEVIEESREPEKTKGYEYWYVPACFVDGVKLLEGVPTLPMVENVLREALK